MLLRASSDAARRNRFESSSAANDRKSGFAENPGQNGGYQGALVAANTAYRRAHGTAIPQEKGRVANKLQKNRAGTSSEGSHLAHRRRGQLRKSTSSDAALTVHQLGWQRYGEGSDIGYAGCDGYGLRPQSPIARAQDFLEADAQLGIQSTPEEKIASAPSSYRKLPKSASAQAPKSNGTTMQTRKTQGQNSEEDGDARTVESSLAATRLRNGFVGSEISDGLSVPDVISSNEEHSRNINRDKILRNFQQMRLHERPSLNSLVTRRRRDHTPLHSSFDNPSNVTFHKENVQTSDDVGQSSSSNRMDNKAKDDSKSLKSRLKRMFRRSSQMEDCLPVQHLEATKLHFGSDITSITSSKRRSDSYTDSEEKRLLRDSPDISFMKDISVPEDHTKSRASSGTHSEGGDSNTKSRVTSWSNSTVANTLSSKPLSIINEYVSRAQSLSLSHRAVSNSSEQAQPISQSAYAYGQTTDYKGIDARQLCSALMKNEAEQDSRRKYDVKQINSSNNGVLSSVHQSLPSQSRNTSLGSLATRLRLSRSNAGRASPGTSFVAHNQSATTGYIEDADSAAMLFSYKPPLPATNDSPLDRDKILIPKRRIQEVSKLTSPSAEDIARRINRDQNRWRATLEEVKFTDPIIEVPHQSQLEDVSERENDSPRHVKALIDDHKRSPIKFASPRLHVEGEPFREHSPNLRRWVKDVKAITLDDQRNRLTGISNYGEGMTSLGDNHAGPKCLPIASDSPSKASQPVPGLKNALRPKNNTDEDLNAASRELPKQRGHRREHAQIIDTEPTLQESSVIMTANMKETSSRPILESRQTSRMNERFPMIETGRDQYLQSKLPEDTTLSNSKKVAETGDKENQTTRTPKENRLIHNKFQSLQTIKARPVNDRSSNSSNIHTSALLQPEVDLNNKTDFRLRPSPLRQNLSLQTSKARSIVDLRSQSYDATRIAQPPSMSPTTLQHKQIRRKPTTVTALNVSSTVSRAAVDEPNSYLKASIHANSPSSTSMAATSTAALAPSRPNRMNARSYTADLHSRYVLEEPSSALSTVENNQPQTPSPSPSRSRSRLGGSVTPTSGQRMADVFINSRLKGQQLSQHQHQHQQHHNHNNHNHRNQRLPWLRQPGDSPVFL